MLKRNTWLISTVLIVAGLFMLLVNADWDLMFYSLTDSDVSQVAWNTDHFAWCVKNFKNPYYTNVLFQPNGEKLIMHTYNQFFGIINLFVNDIPLSVNIGLFMSFVVGAAGFFLFARRFGMTDLQCMAVALIASFNYYTLNKLGLHLNLVCFWVFPFAAMCWLDIKGFNFDLPLNKGKLSLFVLCLLLAWICDFYVLFYILSFACLHLLFVYGGKAIKTSKLSMPVLVLTLVGALVLCHLLSRLLWVEGFSTKGGIWGSADIRLLFVPGPGGRFMSGSFREFSHILAFENYVFLGYFLSFVFTVAIVYKFWYRINSFSAFFLFMIVSYLLFIFPDVRYNDEHLFFTPFSFIHYIPFIDQLRSPARFMEMIFLFVPLFVFHIINHCHIKLGKLKTVMPLLIFLVSLLEFLPDPFKRYDVNKRIADAKVSAIDLGNKSVLQMPFCRGDGMQCFGIYNQDDYFFQIANRCRIWGGYIARMSDETVSITDRDVFFESLVAIQDPNNSFVVRTDARAYRPQSGPEPHYIIIDKRAIANKDRVLNWFLTGPFKQVFEDERYIGLIYK